jgi:signal transduction histidine kinase
LTRFLPRSLFGRTLLVLAAGLLLAQLASQLVNLVDRSSSVYRLAAFQLASRIAQASRILNRLPGEARTAVVQEIDDPHLTVTLSRRPLAVSARAEQLDRYEKAFAESLRRQLERDWPLSVAITPEPRSRRAPGEGTVASPFEVWIAHHFYFLLPGRFSLVAQVGLEDGTTAVFYARMPQEPLNRLESLLPRLGLTLVIFLALTALVVRMITRSLQRLARAATQLGANMEGAPLPEAGPQEVRSVIGAFNRMQAQISGHVLERTRLLGAISHDLKTPLARMRLRTELLPDAGVRAKFVRDLDEMDSMVGSTLEFLGSLGRSPELVPVDVGALLESLCEDYRETGADVTLAGEARVNCSAHPQALRRCLANLIDNALRYAGSAEVALRNGESALSITVRDRGPGIPEADVERVFDPYFRLDVSRNRESGGTGLGLSIARNIARWHGGEIRLRNADDGPGLIAELTVPRRPGAGAAPVASAGRAMLSSPALMPYGDR